MELFQLIQQKHIHADLCRSKQGSRNKSICLQYTIQYLCASSCGVKHILGMYIQPLCDGICLLLLLAYLSSNYRKKNPIISAAPHTTNATISWGNEFRMAVRAVEIQMSFVVFKGGAENPQNITLTVIVFIKLASIQSRESAERL